MTPKEKAELLDIIHKVSVTQMEVCSLMETMKAQVSALITEGG